MGLEISECDQETSPTPFASRSFFASAGVEYDKEFIVCSLESVNNLVVSEGGGSITVYVFGGCERCWLWGKLQVLGLGKVLNKKPLRCHASYNGLYSKVHPTSDRNSAGSIPLDSPRNEASQVSLSYSLLLTIMLLVCVIMQPFSGMFGYGGPIASMHLGRAQRCLQEQVNSNTCLSQLEEAYDHHKGEYILYCCHQLHGLIQDIALPPFSTL
ncbi:hypothetical protein QYF36_022892 [Acer negundo]|nr:hypothetical protein QYF36_022892 [Acer negundo]